MTWLRDYWWLIMFAVLLVPACSVVVFASWLKRQPHLSVEETVKCWDVFIKLVSAFTVIVTGAMLFGKYVDQQEQEGRARIEQQLKESDLRTAEFLRQQVTFETERHQRKRRLFDEAKVVSARLLDSPIPRDAVKRFDELYFADLIGVEQLKGPVEAAMVRLRRKLRNESPVPHDSLEQLTLQLATACEQELKASEDSLTEQYRKIAALITVNTK